MGGMRKWLTTGGEDGKGKGKVAVVHCKAGKGRSGSVATGYLICEEGWKREDALRRFTERRMRVGFGEGVSIPSQLRWVGYMDRWTNELGKRYVERRVEICEIHVWGLRDGVKVAVEGYVEEGRKIQCFHVFRKDERILVDDGKGNGIETSNEMASATSTPTTATFNSTSDASTPVVSTPQSSTLAFNPALTTSSTSTTLKSSKTSGSGTATPPATISAAILRPATPLILPTSDINIDLERRNRASYTGLTMVTSIAHVWFNAWFEGGCRGETSGVFEIIWDEMDGIKGSKRKGVKALEKVAVVWRYVDEPFSDGVTGGSSGIEIREPRPEESTHDLKPADWRGEDEDQGQTGIEDTASPSSTSSLAPATSEPVHRSLSSESKTASAGVAITAGVMEAKHLVKRELGLRKVGDESRDVSRASSVRDEEDRKSEDSEEGVNEGAVEHSEVKPEPQATIEAEAAAKAQKDTEPGVTEPTKTDEVLPTTTLDKREDEDESTLNFGNVGLGRLAGIANSFLPASTSAEASKNNTSGQEEQIGTKASIDAPTGKETQTK